MAANDITVLQEKADGSLKETLLTPAVIGAVATNPTNTTGADAISNIMSLTQAEYDAIVSPDAATLYVIV
jgi:hypothetical protein